LQAYQDKSLPLEKRAEIGRSILYGPNLIHPLIF